MDPRSLGSGSPFGFPFQLSRVGLPFPPQFSPDGRYNWDMNRFLPSPLHRYGKPFFLTFAMCDVVDDFSGSPVGMGDLSFGRTLMPPDYTFNPFWEQMYRLHSNQLRGIPLDPQSNCRSLPGQLFCCKAVLSVPRTPDYLCQQANPPLPSDVFIVHPNCSAPSVVLPYTAEGEKRS